MLFSKMDLEDFLLRETKQTRQEKYHMTSHICGLKQTTIKIQSHRQTTEWWSPEAGGGVWVEWVKGSRDTNCQL